MSTTPIVDTAGKPRYGEPNTAPQKGITNDYFPETQIHRAIADMSHVLFVGDVNVDIIMGGLGSLPLVDREVTCSSYDLVMGSSAVISACAYAALGGNAHCAGLAGDDENGRFMVAGLRDRGVGTDLVELRSDTATGVTINLIHDSTRTQVTFPGAIAEFDGSQITPETLAGFQHVHFAGVYLQTRLRPRLTGLLQTAHRTGAATSLDPQWDPRECWDGMPEWLPELDYLFVNKDEACSIAGTPDAKRAAEILGSRCGAALVKAGSGGAYVCGGAEAVHVPTAAVDVVDTTGAGDCFDAAFLHRVVETKADILTACRVAVAVATASCTVIGGVVDPAVLQGATRGRTM